MRYLGRFYFGGINCSGHHDLDVIVIYTFLQVKKGRFVLALWTSFLNMAFPFLGFVTGEFSSHLFWVEQSISGILLGLIGIHMLLQE